MSRIYGLGRVVILGYMALGLSATPAWCQAASMRTPQTVTVGVYLNQVPALDLKTNSFIADFYLWFRWAGSLDPTHTFEFMNVWDRNTLWKDAGYKDANGAEKPERLAHGLQYQVYHVQGRFAQPYKLTDYPLDHQQLTLGIEDKLYDANILRYLADDTDSKVNPDAVVPGWIMQSFLARSLESNYSTNFGDPDTPAASTHKYSHASFVMNVARPTNSVLLKTVLPLLIVLLVALSALLLKTRDITTRTMLTLTTLISAIALHYSNMGDLPPTGYLILLDKLYILSYLIILAATVASIGAYRLVDADREGLARRVNMGMLGGLVCFTILAFSLQLYWH